MECTPHVYSTPAELEAARAKCAAHPWAHDTLEKMLSHTPAPGQGLPGNVAWRWALAGTLAGREDVQQRAAETISAVRDIVTACGGNALHIAWGLNPYIAAYELVRHLLPSSEQERLVAMMRDGVTAIWANNRRDANCQTMYNAAVTGFGLLVNEESWVERAVADEERGLLRHLRQCLRADGLWWEGSLSYHMEVVLAIQIQAEMLRRAGRDLYQDPGLAAIMRTMYDAPLRAVSPTLVAFNKNDGSVTESLPAWSALYEIAYARLRDPRYGMILSTGRRTSPEALLYGEAEVVAAPLSAESAVMPNTGWAVLRAPHTERYWLEEGMCALLDFGPHGGWHGHPDALSLDLQALGTMLLLDQGSSPIGYVGREHWEWFRQTLAHNTVTVDGVPQRFVYGDDDGLKDASAGGELTLAALGSAIEIVEARHDTAYPGATYRRAVVAVGKEYLVDFFHVAQSGTHVFDYALHGMGWLTLDQPTVPARDTFQPTAQRGQLRDADHNPWEHSRLFEGEWRAPGQDPHAAYGYAQDVYACEANGPVRATFQGGLWGDGHFWPGGPSLAVHTVPDAPCRFFACRTPRRHPASYGPTLIVRRTGSVAHIISVLAPYRTATEGREWGLFTGSAVTRPAPQPPAVSQVRLCAAEGEMRGVMIDTPTGVDVVLHTFGDRASAVVERPSISFTGKCCWLRFDAQRQLRAVQITGGLHLEVGRRTIFHADNGQAAAYTWSAL